MSRIIGKIALYSNKEHKRVMEYKREKERVLFDHLVFAIEQSPDMHDTFCCWEKYLKNNINGGMQKGQFYYKKGTKPPYFYGHENMEMHQDIIDRTLSEIKAREEEIRKDNFNPYR